MGMGYYSKDLCLVIVKIVLPVIHVFSYTQSFYLRLYCNICV